MSAVWGDSGQAPRMASLLQRRGEMRKSVYRSGHICPSWHDTWPFVWCSRQKATVWKFTSIFQKDLMNRPKRQCNVNPMQSPKRTRASRSSKNYIPYTCNNSKKKKKEISNIHTAKNSTYTQKGLVSQSKDLHTHTHTHSKDTHIHLLKFIFYGYFPG